MRNHSGTADSERKCEHHNGLRRLGAWGYVVLKTAHGLVGVFSPDRKLRPVRPSAHDERLRARALRQLLASQGPQPAQ